MTEHIELLMPIKATPYGHQKKAFAFAMEVFGVFEEGGDANDSDARIFGTSFYAFRNKYFEMGGYGNHTPIFRKWMADDFLRKLHSVTYRVTKAECLDLPAITEEVRVVDLEKDAKKLYDRIEDESYAEMEKSEVTTMNILTRLLRLSRITGGHLTDDDGVVNTVSSAKLDALSDIIDDRSAQGQRLRRSGGRDRQRKYPGVLRQGAYGRVGNR